MPTYRITKSFVDRAKGPTSDSSSKQKLYFDSTLRGFGLRVTSNGAKSYIIQYRNVDGRERRSTIGKHGQLTPDKARRIALTKLGEVAEGFDPAEEKLMVRRAPSMRDLSEDYLSRHAIPYKRPNSIRDDMAYLNGVVIPKIGHLKVKAVSQRDIEDIVQSLKKTPYKSNRVRALLSKMFTLSIQWKWRTDNPVIGVAKLQEHRRERWLSQEEIERLVGVLSRQENQVAANAVLLMLLTGARRGEVLGATWDQIDIRRGVWTKPAHFTKQKRTEHTPLSSAAIVLLRKVRKEATEPSQYIFPGASQDKPIKDIKIFWTKVRDENAGAILHH